MRLVWMAFFAVITLVLAGFCTTQAGVPEYMKANLEINQAFEIKGHWSEHGYFVATDIEALPRPRKPKLRGRILKIDDTAHTVTVFGRTIHVSSKTRFINDGGKETVFDDLKVGKQIEVSCKVDSAGTWYARHIKARGVKASLKIKGTLTRIAVDGTPPDTVEIDGLLILLEKLTDLKAPESHGYLMQDDLFGDLANKTPAGMNRGFQLNQRFLISGQYRQSFRSQSEFDLSNQVKADQDNTEQDLRLKLYAFLSPDIRGFAQLRVRSRLLLTNEQNLASNSFSAQFTELYLLAPDIGGRGFALQVGRQDFEEQREWLFDEYLDAVRAYYFGVAPLLVEAAVVHSVEPLKPRFKTWTDLFAQVKVFANMDNVAAAYILSRSDTDTSRFREPLWYGLRYYGLLEVAGRYGGYVTPWFNLAIMRGSDKGKDISASAVDFGATWQMDRLGWSPSITLGRAVGSGDDTPQDNITNTFRQSGYDDNVARWNEVTSVKYYGTVLDPELSNMEIWTLGVGVHPLAKSSVDVIYHSYRQNQPDVKLRGANLISSARPNGLVADIGWGLDVIFASQKFWDRVHLKWTLGFFHPGSAFSGFDENAFLNKIQMALDLG